ncbi:MAG: cyclopropane-fatty-acyl-phospholipid synthase [Frankiales bacterium]|jgi:cyclopropane-fatty-acyl-phospholipid synthase|nr:cyclopropane-fatty-acyl-phospholipid synthase [Frankiales bacterium]
MALASVIHDAVGAPARLRVTAFDGSSAGADDAPLGLHLRTPLAVRYLISGGGSLGLTRAFVTGDLVLEGSAYDVLDAVTNTSSPEVKSSHRLAVVREAVRVAGLGVLVPLAPPTEEVKLRGWRHSMRRDSAAISHHYDVSNRFYEYVLGPTMAYTCACYPRPDATLEEAQFHKFDLVARKLALEPGMRLLDVGCGWGGMVMHAAKEYGVTALGVTLSRQQAEWAQKAIADAGLSDRAEVRHLDYRLVTESGFDAVSSIGLTEHIGEKELPAYFSFLHSRLRPQGRLLNHCIMRPTTLEKANIRNGFINRYVFPDGELEGLGTIVTAMQNNGFEVRHEENLREHYAQTLKHWCENLDAHWDEAVNEVGANKARVWQLYMAGSRLGFDRRDIELHQVLGVKTENGESGFPLRSDWEPPTTGR